MSLMMEDMVAVKDVVYSGRKVKLDKLNKVNEPRVFMRLNVTLNMRRHWRLIQLQRL